MEAKSVFAALAVLFLRLRLDQPSEVPAVVIAFDSDDRRRQLDLVEDDPLRDQIENAVIDLDRLDRDNALAGNVDGYIGQVHAEEEIAADAADASARR